MAEKTTAELVIKVDSDGAKLAGENLENLTVQGKKSEKATKALETAAAKLTAKLQLQAKSVGKTAGETKILELREKGATNAMLKAAISAEKLTQANKKAALATRANAQSAGAIGGPFRAMRGSVQQASFQLQDIAVQAQMGTSAFTILGQQGPQLASVFGPGGAVFGALIAFGAIAGQFLYKALTGTGEAMKELAEDAKTLRDTFDDLGPASQEFQRFLAAKEIIEGTKNLANLRAELLKGQKVMVTGSAGVMGRITSTKKATETDTEWTERSLLLNQQIERGTLLLAMKKEAVDNLRTDTEKLIDKIKEEIRVTGESATAIVETGQAYLNATKPQQKAIDLLNVELADKKEKIELDKEIAKQAQKDAKDAIKREEKLEMFFFKAQDRKKKEEARADKKLQRDKDSAVQMATDTANLGLNEFDAMTVKHEALEAELQRHLDANLISMQQNAEALEGIEREKTAFAESEEAARRQIQLQVIGAAAGAVGQLQGIAEEGSKEAKILFAMQKALAIAQIIVATEQSAALASVFVAGGGPIAWLASQAGIRAMGYASAGIVAGTAIAGGRALGGQVRGGESYLVGERGPELLTMGTSGRIATNENLKNAVNGDNSNSSNVINVNFSVQANDTAGFDRLLQSRRGQIVGMINQAVNNRGRSSIV